jgi:hypothetical protein
LWHKKRFTRFYNMKKIIGACSALVFVALFGLLLADKSLATGGSPPPHPTPTNAAPASIN